MPRRGSSLKENCILAEELVIKRSEKSLGVRLLIDIKRATPKSSTIPKSCPGVAKRADPLTLSLRRQADFIPSGPSHITRYFGYQSFLSWSPYRQDLWGPARPQRVQVTADSAGRREGKGEKFISTRSPKPVVQRPRDVLTSTHLRTTSTYRCVVSFVTFFSSLSLSLSLLRTIYNNTIYHETRFETSPLTLERRSETLKMSFLKFISARSMQPVVSRPRQRLNHSLHRYFHVTFVWDSQVQFVITRVYWDN